MCPNIEVAGLDSQGKSFSGALLNCLPLVGAVQETNPAVIYAGFKIGTLEMHAIEAATHDPDSTVACDVWATKLRPLPSEFEYIVVECAPDLSSLNIALLGMGDAIVVPAPLDSAGPDAVASFLEYVDPDLETTGNPVGCPVWVLPRPSTVGGLEELVVPERRRASGLSAQLLPVVSRILGAVDVDEDRTDHDVETPASPATAFDRFQKNTPPRSALRAAGAVRSGFAPWTIALSLSTKAPRLGEKK